MRRRFSNAQFYQPRHPIDAARIESVARVALDDERSPSALKPPARADLEISLPDE
jgi:hypothetical protein